MSKVQDKYSPVAYHRMTVRTGEGIKHYWAKCLAWKDTPHGRGFRFLVVNREGQPAGKCLNYVWGLEADLVRQQEARLSLTYGTLETHR